MKHTDIYRTYYGGRRNISGSAWIIHNYLFTRENSVSKYTKEDAELLTQMFKDLKYAYTQNQKSISGYAKGMILGNTIKNIPILDFALGGQSQGGVLFEKELLKLFAYETEEAMQNARKNVGQQTAASYINLGTEDASKAKEIINNLLNDEIEEKLKYTEKNIVQGGDIGAAPPTSLYLKIGAKRFGKIDVMAGDGATINFEVEGEYKDPLKKAIDIATKASFSVKSYLTGGDIHLGNTSKKKAVSAVSEYVAAKSNEDARWAGIYFLHHPNGIAEEDIKQEKEKAGTVLYQHYDHMHKVYELTGIGLRYGDLSDLYSVDFLLVNRAGSDSDIMVYSCQDLLKTLELNKYQKFDIK